jgi:hypothetical protein
LVSGSNVRARFVNGGDKADHSAAQIPAMERAPSGMTRALSE